MTKNKKDDADGPAGVFYPGREILGRLLPVALWRMTTTDVRVALEVLERLGGFPDVEKDGGLLFKVSTAMRSVPVALVGVAGDETSFRLLELPELGTFVIRDHGLARWLTSSDDVPRSANRARVGEPADLVIKAFRVTTRMGGIVIMHKPVILAASA